MSQVVGPAALQIVCARREDLGRYLDFLEEVTDWLLSRGIRQWTPGNFRRSSDYYSAAIDAREVQLAFVHNELVGTLRLLHDDPVVWPDLVDEDSVYLYTLAVKRAWANQQVGRRLLQWAEERAIALGRRRIRLDCFESNAFLRDYYERAGFIDRGVVDARYEDPVGTLRLRRFEKRLVPSGDLCA